MDLVASARNVIDTCDVIDTGDAWMKMMLTTLIMMAPRAGKGGGERLVVGTTSRTSETLAFRWDPLCKTDPTQRLCEALEAQRVPQLRGEATAVTMMMVMRMTSTRVTTTMEMMMMTMVMMSTTMVAMTMMGWEGGEGKKFGAEVNHI